jgi:DNA-binding transcriptional LysR family regulator
MQLRHLRYFVVVAQELSITRAAARLRLSQPPLSRQMRDLEEEIGVPLFDRTNRRLQLTAAGELFYQEARRILSQLERATYATRAKGLGRAERIAIGFPGTLAGMFLPQILRRFRQAHPSVDIDLAEMVPLEQLAALREAQIDLAFVAKVEVESAKEFAFESVMDVPLYVALARDHRLAKAKRISLYELRDEPFISVEQPATHEYFLRLCRSAGFEPRVVKQTDLSQSILDLIAAAVGLAILPKHFERYQADIVMRPLVARHATVPLCMVWRQDDESIPLRMLRTLILEYFRQHGAGTDRRKTMQS